MTFRSSCLVLLSALWLGVVWTLPANAQEKSSLLVREHSARVDPALIAALYMASDVSVASQATQTPSPTTARAYPGEDRRRLRRSRVLLAFGTGMLLGAAAGVIAAGRDRRCYLHGSDEDRRLDRTAPRTMGAVVGGLGLGFVLTGALRLRGVPAETRVALRAKPWLGPVALGGAAIGFLTTALSAVSEQAICWDS